MAFVGFPAAGISQNLVINNFHARTIVYEIPDSAGRAEAVRYIERMRDQFSPGVDIVDATSLDDTALRQKLTGTVRLYTLLSENSRLLRLTAGRLPLRIERGILHWSDFSAPANGLRMVFVGRNPYGEGYWVVYAAGSNSLLAQAHAVFHGPCSYHIFQGVGEGRLLREGFYDGNFAEKPDRLALTEAAADVREYFSVLEKSHPNLLAKVTRRDYEALKRQTEDGLAARLDGDGRIRIEDLADSLCFAAAFFRDGHTSIRWQPLITEATARGKRFPPFWLDSENGRFFIVSAADRKLSGAEVLAINGVRIDDFLKPAFDRISAETRTFRAALFASSQLTWYYLKNLFANESYRLKIREADGAVREPVVRTVSLTEFRNLAPPHRYPPATQLEFLDDGRVAHLWIPSLVYNADRRKSEEVFDRDFEQIRQRGSRDLIIDIRGNGGGDSRMGNYVLRFVRHGHAAPAASFSGKTYMLTDHYVFSSAVMFADAFRDYQVGTIIGYETGGTPSHFGYPRFFTLKNSGIEYGVSRTHFDAPRPRPGDDSHGVLPDVPVNRERLAAYLNGGDPVLSFAVDYIRKAREAPGP